MGAAGRSDAVARPGAGGVVSRSGLFERLGASARVTVVSAPPGSGKTVLLRSWIGAAGLAECAGWVPVGHGERDPQLFWPAVVGALRRTAPGSALVQDLTAAPDLDGWAITERLLKELAPLEDRIWLVIDDTQELGSAEALRQLELLVMRGPPELRFVLATRHDLRLGLHRLRLEGELTEIRADDLRFTAEEARGLFQAAGVELAGPALAMLYERTEGWAAGLRLAALSLTGHPDPERFAAEFSGSERTVAEYLLAEVLDRQSEEVRRLLLRTCLVERVSGELADALSGESGGHRILQELEEANAFVVTLDAPRSWFRYHRLFADLLQRELRSTAAGDVTALHRAAAGWFAGHGYPVEAIRHSQGAQDWGLAARLLADAWPGLHLGGQAATVHALLAEFPVEARDGCGARGGGRGRRAGARVAGGGAALCDAGGAGIGVGAGRPARTAAGAARSGRAVAGPAARRPAGGGRGSPAAAGRGRGPGRGAARPRRGAARAGTDQPRQPPAVALPRPLRRRRRFHIHGVTGPDEYSALGDDNVYTNLMARRNLLAAADAAKRYPERARELGVNPEESAGWRDAAQAMTIPFDETLGVHPQAEGFTRRQVWDFARTPAEQYPLMLHFPYFDLYRKQVVKQADLVLAMHLHGSAFTAEQKVRNFDYYERLTVRDSSLSACTQAAIAAETGHLDLAYDYLGEAALMDLRDLEHNTRDGVHIASLAGTWVALVSGFGGLRDADGTFSFAPRLPPGLTRLAFTLFIRGRRLRVEITHAQATYALADGDPLQILHHGQPVTLAAGKPEPRPILPAPSRPRPSQPPGREPARRGPAGNPG
jgi:hypothetical protein